MLNRAVSVYPRVCGVDSTRTSGTPRGHGLSPRVRGRFGFTIVADGVEGFIPACAG